MGWCLLPKLGKAIPNYRREQLATLEAKSSFLGVEFDISAISFHMFWCILQQLVYGVSFGGVHP